MDFFAEDATLGGTVIFGGHLPPPTVTLLAPEAEAVLTKGSTALPVAEAKAALHSV
jgi:hypothetical protein